MSMFKQRIELLFRKHKEKIFIGIILLLLLLLFLKNNNSGVLKEDVVTVPKVTQSIETTDLFIQSTPYVLEPGSDWTSKVTKILDKNWNVKEQKTQVLTESIPQKVLQGTTDFKQYQVYIQNDIASYVSAIQAKDYDKALSYYVKWAPKRKDITENNYTNLFQINWNPIVTDVVPLYEYMSSKSLVRTTLQWEFTDKITGKTNKTWDIYSIWDGKGFKILPPEFVNVIYDPKVKASVERLITWTKTNKTHYVELTLSDIFQVLPNRLIFRLIGKTNENVFFNKVKVTLYNNKTREILYKDTVVYSDVTEKANWKLTYYKWKGFTSTFNVNVDFPKSNFNAIYDKLMNSEKTGLNYGDLNIAFKPENDTDNYLEYPEFIFNLRNDPLSENESVPKDDEYLKLQQSTWSWSTNSWSTQSGQVNTTTSTGAQTLTEPTK